MVEYTSLGEYSRIWKDKALRSPIGSIFVYYFVDPDLRVEIIFRKERTAESGGIDFEIVDIDTSAHWY